jgi:membrane fusion protein (multidrug efflux system)
MRRTATSGHPIAVRYFLALVGLLAVIAGLGGIKYSQISSLMAMGKAMAQAGPPPEVVSTAVAEEQTWEGRVSAVGTVNPARGVTVANDAAGVVSAIRFESGQVVKQGQVLLELDSSVERAQLASAQARRELAKVSADRSKALVEKAVASKSQLDSDEASLKSAGADVAALSAQIDRKTVRAPFDGRLGIRQVNLGQYLNPGTAVTVLQATDGVYVDFTLPQQQLANLAVGGAVRLTSDAITGTIDGQIAAIDPTLDQVSRSIKVRASVAGKSADLHPGMFVEVAVILPARGKVITVPATAVVHASYGNSVFVVEDKKDDKGNVVNGPDGKPAKAARQQFVRTGESRGDFVAIGDGVKPGQVVVTAGAFKLRNGAGIIVNNTLAPAPQLAPKVENR